MSTTFRLLVAAAAVALSLTQSAAAQQAAQPAASHPAAASVERPPIVPLSAADAEKYLGDYDIKLPGGKLPFRVFTESVAFQTFTEESAVMGQGEGQDMVPLRYIGNDTFGADFDPTLRLTFTVENGRVTGGKLLQGGATMNVTRRQ